MPALVSAVPCHASRATSCRGVACALALLAGCASEPVMHHAGDAAHAASTGSPRMLQPVAGAQAADTGCRPHAPTAQELAKQRRAVDPLKMPALYRQVFYGARGEPPGAYGVDRLRLRLFKRFEQPGTGLMGVVLLDEPSGHAVVLFKGMDRPFVERGGLGGALTDLGGVLRARFGGGNPQLPGGDDAYTEALCEPAIRSVEMVGYSMGSQVANFLAVKYGAHAVVFADMGIDGALLRRHARGDLAGTRAGARERIVSLSLGGDLIVRIFGVGEVIGTVVPLPGGLAGALHQPEIYADAADEMIRQLKRPDAALAAAGAGARPAGRTLQRRAPGP